MTHLSKIKATCANCDSSFVAVSYNSINAWMDPGLIEHFLKDGLSVECPGCQNSVLLETEILINGKNDAKLISNIADYESKLEELKKIGAVDENGKIFEFMGLGFVNNT